MLSIDDDAIRSDAIILDKLCILFPPRCSPVAVPITLPGGVCPLCSFPDAIFTRYSTLADVA